jgi:CheY-like chemotaxis protein
MGNCETVVVIEDDEPIRNVIQEALEIEGYRVIVAGDGKEGLEVLKKATTPCLILLDLMLPIMNGWEFMEELRKDNGNMLAAIPIVITSAAGGAAKTAVEHAQGYIRKPIDLELLLSTVRKFCGCPH